jgi:hypothetical protein
MSGPEAPFRQDVRVDKPGIVGARWWNESLLQQEKEMSRRAAMGALTAAGVATLAVGACGAGVYFAARDPYEFASRDSLGLQRAHGWNVGATDESLVYTGLAYQPFDPASLAYLERDLTPVRWTPFHIPTLLQSPTATPTQPLAVDAGKMRVRLDAVIRPISLPEMDWAYYVGEGLASLFASVPAQVAVVVDLPGPLSVALAAGAAGVFDPVFLLDNWPHPKGLHPAHLGLCAAAHYQPLFAARRAQRSPQNCPPLFVLDRGRLAEFSLAADRFDNRYMARLPSSASLRGSGVTRAIYLVDGIGNLPEADDLNELFVGWKRDGIDLKALDASAFRAEGEPLGARGPYGTKYYGGSDATHLGFWQHYPWAQLPAGVAVAPPVVNTAVLAWPFAPRTTRFVRGGKPAGFGTTEVAVDRDSHAVLGTRADRNGSWNRVYTGSSSSGGYRRSSWGG